MTNLDIAHQRLHNQLIERRTFENPSDVVQWLGAVQAQDFAVAKWALGLRIEGATDESIERAFANGTILRTHVMRPTWHFVAPADIRWMLALTAPRIKTSMAAYTRSFGLDAAQIVRMESVIERALEGGRNLTRPELGVALREADLEVADGAMLGVIA